MRYLLCLFILLFSVSAGLAQVCNCPPVTTCKPCSGGYTSLTLRYLGPAPALVLIKDVEGVRANLFLSPQEEFTFTGTKKNEKFAVKEIPVLVNGIVNTVLGSSCADLSVGSTYGNFLVISAVSISGSIVCCTTPAPDLTPPQFSSYEEVIIASATDQCGAMVSWAPPVATDNCQLAGVTSTHNPGDFFPIGTTQVSYIATDAAGLTTTINFNVNVSDTKPPVFTGGESTDLRTEAQSSCGTAVSWVEPVASDECKFTVTKSHSPADVFPVGTTVVKYVATDASGNVAERSFKITVVDTQAPVLQTLASEKIEAEVDENCQAIVTWEELVFADACSFKVKQSHKPGDNFKIGTTEVRYSATDLLGNTMNVSFNVIVSDKQSPKFLSFPNDIFVATEGKCSTKVSWTLPSIADNCSSVTLISSHKPNDEFALGTTLVTYTATDSSGNATIKEFKITVKDSLPLSFANCPTDIVTTADESSYLRMSWVEPSVANPCEVVTLTSNYTSDYYFPMGRTQVEYTATTSTGKKAHCKFQVVILEKEKLLEVTKLITPDGDGINDRWMIANIEKYPNNLVVLADRWGSIIYEASNYNNGSVSWNGTNRSGGAVQSGTYFYTIIANNGKATVRERGFVEVLR